MPLNPTMVRAWPRRTPMQLAAIWQQGAIGLIVDRRDGKPGELESGFHENNVYDRTGSRAQVACVAPVD